MKNAAWTTALLLSTAAITFTTSALDAQLTSSVNTLNNTAKRRLAAAYGTAAARKKRSHSIAYNRQKQATKSAKWAFDTSVRNADKWLGGAYRTKGNKLNYEFRKIQATRRPGKLAIDRTREQSYRKTEYTRQNAHKSYKAAINSAYGRAESAKRSAYAAAARMWSNVTRRGRTDRQAADRLAVQCYGAASKRYNATKASASRSYNAARRSNYQRAGRMAANVRIGWRARADRAAYVAMQNSIAAAKRSMDASIQSAKAARARSYNVIVSRERTTRTRTLAARNRGLAVYKSSRTSAYSRWQSQTRSADATAKRLRTNAFNRSVAAKKQLEANIARAVASARRVAANANRASKSKADSSKRTAYDQRVRAANSVAGAAIRKADDQERRDRQLAYAAYVRSTGSRG